MDSGVLRILGFVLIFVALDVLALRFGHDVRRWVREMPFGSGAVLTLPQPPALRIRSRATQIAERWIGRLAAVAALHPAGAKPFHPPVLRDVLCCQSFDLAAAGK